MDWAINFISESNAYLGRRSELRLRNNLLNQNSLYLATRICECKTPVEAEKKTFLNDERRNCQCFSVIRFNLSEAKKIVKVPLLKAKFCQRAEVSDLHLSGLFSGKVPLFTSALVLLKWKRNLNFARNEIGEQSERETWGRERGARMDNFFRKWVWRSSFWAKIVQVPQ